MDTLYFNKNLKYLTSNTIITQSELSRILGVSRQAVYNLLNKESDCRLSTILKIADAYKAFINVDGFCQVATIREIEEHESNLNIANYVIDESLSSIGDKVSLDDAVSGWNEQSSVVDKELVSLSQIINGL